MKYIQYILIAIALSLSALAYISIPNTAQFGADSIKYVAGQVYTLKGSGVSSTATNIDLNSFTIPQTGQVLTQSDFGDIGYGTIEPGSDDRQEIISWTGITQNADGSARLTGVTRGLSPIAPYTASSTLQFAHSGGSRFIVSNAPQLFDELAAKDNDETITGVWTFDADNLPITDADVNATSSRQFATKYYVDNTTNQGAATSTESNGGIVELATKLEQASSTDLGAEKPLALQAKYATSTSNGSVSALHTIIADNAGKLATSWINSAYTYIFGAITATTGNFTILDINIASAPVLRTAANGQVTSATAGTHYAPVQYTFATSTMATATNGFASSTTFVLPADITTASTTINVRANVQGRNTSSATGDCTFYLRESSGADIFSVLFGDLVGISGENIQGGIDVDILANNSETAQIILGNSTAIREENISSQTPGTFEEINTTDTLDFTSAVNLVGVVESSAANVHCDIESLWIKVN